MSKCYFYIQAQPDYVKSEMPKCYFVILFFDIRAEAVYQVLKCQNAILFFDIRAKSDCQVRDLIH